MRWVLVPSALFIAVVVSPHWVFSWTGETQLEAGYAFRADRSTGVVSSWQNSSALFVGGTRGVRPGLEISGRVSLRSSRFSEYRGGGDFDVHVPEAMFGPYHSGQLQAVEATVGARAVRSGRVSLTQGFSVGVLAARLPRASRDAWDMNYPEDVHQEVAFDTGKVVLKPLMGLATGVVFPCFDSVGVGASGELWFSPNPPWSHYLLWPQLSVFLQVRHQ